MAKWLFALLRILVLSGSAVAARERPLREEPRDSPQPQPSSQRHDRFSLQSVYHAGVAGQRSIFRRLDVPSTHAHDLNSSDIPTFLLSHTLRPVPQWTDHASRARIAGPFHKRGPQDVLNVQYEGPLVPMLSGSAKVMARPMPVPDHTDPDTILTLGQMAENAYRRRDDDRWIDIDGWEPNDSFGWEEDGLRGHVFLNDDASIIVISFKGTSANVFGIGGGPTSSNDKYNDNIMFSCCCAKVTPTWHPVCECAHFSSHTCSTTCLDVTIRYSESYYRFAQLIYEEVWLRHPRAAIWFTGHSLGGSLASLMGITYNLPAIPFQAPGERLYASRLGLLPTHGVEDFIASLPIYHIGNNGDPVFLGRCNGPASSCYYGGYAMESKCHLGRECIYDIGDAFLKVDPSSLDDQDRAWYEETRGEWLRSAVRPPEHKLDIRYHKMQLIMKLFLDKRFPVPECEFEPDCADCENWTMVD
ncbi:Alpha/Beta hydrolase protein [Polychytrium aggregatum]|uniref:Alpha/Beta hydrolase protein n=1 Tax=Polychytrium aggregatum TaxID=110093 RepID=UPI0022FE13CB|nr:Alpha/Beta hydrolase protein [Polychytrium aggregatum]KAI9199604.1 Alpha/Beta hydrolase protein [Polychytrium aggregatum]